MTRSKIKVSLGISWALLVMATSGLACGLDWRLPTNHFDGVNDQGYVAYWEKMDELDLGEGLKLPLFMGFRSNMELSSPSPYLGSGWIMPLLEANIVQTGENRFVMMQPDGWSNLFLRRDETTLNGSAGWMAEINGNTITAWAKCGWKLEFFKGHIVSMTTPKNRKFEFNYSGNLVTSIRENGVDKLTAEQDSAGEVKALLFNGKRIKIDLDEKPRVENVAGQNVVSGMNRSLKSINPNDGTSKMFEFAVNDKIQPTMKISSPSETERLFTWDPATKQIVSDNDWKYNITPHSDKMSNAAIGRTNGNDKSEYWYDDVSRGLLIMVGPDGIKKEQKRFTSGILNGRIRSEEYSKGDKIVQTYQATYDESGHLLRQQWVADGKQTENRFDYDSNGHCTNAYRNGQKLCSYIWENGKLTEKIYANGNKLIIKPSTINKTISTIPNGNAVQ